jgi:hypothetical protein
MYTYINLNSKSEDCDHDQRLETSSIKSLYDTYINNEN